MLVVSVAIGSPLEGTDCVVDPFEGSGRDRFVIPVEQSRAVGLQGLGHRVQLSDVGSVGASAPSLIDHRSSIGEPLSISAVQIPRQAEPHTCGAADGVRPSCTAIPSLVSRPSHT